MDCHRPLQMAAGSYRGADSTRHVWTVAITYMWPQACTDSRRSVRAAFGLYVLLLARINLSQCCMNGCKPICAGVGSYILLQSSTNGHMLVCTTLASTDKL